MMILDWKGKMNMKKLWQILLVVLFIGGCASHNVSMKDSVYNNPGISTQKIITVTPKYVVIEVDPGVSRLNAIVEVHRLTQRKVEQVGRVQILKFHNGKAAAKILETNKDGIQTGDFVVLLNKTFNEMNVKDFINAVKNHQSNQVGFPKS